MIKEEDSYMKVNPVGPSIPFRMRLKNTDNQTNLLNPVLYIDI